MSFVLENSDRKSGSHFILDDSERFLKLKRLVVTYKRKYEESVQQLQENLSVQVHLQNEMNAADNEILNLKLKAKDFEEENQALQQQLKHVKELFKATNEELNNLKNDPHIVQNESSYKESNQKTVQMERVIKYLREKLEESALETKQLRTDLEILQKQNSVNSTPTNDSIAFSEQVESKKVVLELEQEKEKLQKLLAQKEQQIEVKDDRARAAQQHLAKKIKEIAQLTEINEQQKLAYMEMQANNQALQTRLTELQHALEMQQIQEKRFRDKWDESLKSLEAQITKWEEKYYLLYDECQKTKEKNLELKKIEENYQKMKQLFANFEHLFTPMQNLPQQFLPEIKSTPSSEGQSQKITE